MVIRAGSGGSCCTIVYVSLLSAPDVQLRVSCAAFVRSNTDDVCEAEDCDIKVGRRTFDLLFHSDSRAHHVDLHKINSDVGS